MKVCTLASGSSGNSLLIESEYSKILVDAGISAKQINKRLTSLDIDLSDIDAVITTHEHDDHTKSITKIDIPVFVSSATTHLWKDNILNIREFDSGTEFSIKELTITPFSVPHDAIDPVGYTIQTDKLKIGIVTDIGSVTGLVIERLRNCNLLVLESNHDSELLLYSNYPWELKQRIQSRLGHLSNVQSAGLLSSVYSENLKYVILAHLSSVNNRPDIALTEALKVLQNKGNGHIGVSIAPRNKIGEVIEL